MSKIDGSAAFTNLVDLAAADMGGVALAASDEFFAARDRLLARGRGEFDPTTFSDRGKVMDGWESRRKRVPGHDWCIVRLGVPGVVRGVDIDTNHFLGNHPPYASLDACCLEGDPDADALQNQVEWTEILPQVGLRPGSQNLFAVNAGRYTHVRLHIYPDGGVARLKVYGEPAPAGLDEASVDLAGAHNGGRAVACTDMFFAPMGNLVLPGPPGNMGEGWETRRRRVPGHDWIMVRLGAPGRLEHLEIDTSFFRGNYPDRAAVSGIYWPDAPPYELTASPDWTPVLAETKLRAHTQSRFDTLLARGPFTHVRLDVIPCGGVSRLRVWGRPERADPRDDRVLASVNSATDTDALMRCCGSKRWADGMLARRPFLSRAALYGSASELWWRLGERDWREAFAHHPRIGQDLEALRAKFASTAGWAAGEQSGVQSATEATLRALADGNRAYEQRFGYIFIVRASGRSAEQMLHELQARLDNDPEREICVAAGEQAQITRLRLEKL